MYIGKSLSFILLKSAEATPAGVAHVVDQPQLPPSESLQISSFLNNMQIMTFFLMTIIVWSNLPALLHIVLFLLAHPNTTVSSQPQHLL